MKSLLRVVNPGQRYALAEHLDALLHQDNVITDQVDKLKTDLITDQAGHPEASLVTPVLTKLTEEQRKVVQLCETPRRQADLMKEIGFAHRIFFKKKYLEPLVQAKLIRMTHPDKPTHPAQAYVVTENGLRLLALWKDEAENGKSDL